MSVIARVRNSGGQEKKIILSNIMFFIVLGSSFIAEMLHSILITETYLTTFTVEC